LNIIGFHKIKSLFYVVTKMCLIDEVLLFITEYTVEKLLDGRKS